MQRTLVGSHVVLGGGGTDGRSVYANKGEGGAKNITEPFGRIR